MYRTSNVGCLGQRSLGQLPSIASPLHSQAEHFRHLPPTKNHPRPEFVHNHLQNMPVPQSTCLLQLDWVIHPPAHQFCHQPMTHKSRQHGILA